MIVDIRRLKVLKSKSNENVQLLGMLTLENLYVCECVACHCYPSHMLALDNVYMSVNVLLAIVISHICYLEIMYMSLNVLLAIVVSCACCL